MQIKYDHTFTTYEHKAGTNTYSFRYPDHWLSYNSDHKSVKVRSVRVNAAARSLILKGLSLYKTGTTKLNISFSLSLASGEDMSIFNSKLIEEKKNTQNDYMIDVDNLRLTQPSTTCDYTVGDYEIKYDYANRSLTFIVNNPDMYFVIENDVDASKDLQALLGLEDNELFLNINQYQRAMLSPGEEVLLEDYFNSIRDNIYVEFFGKELHKLVFYNVWDRGRIIVTSSLSSLCENQYLMVSNTVNIPPKEFKINSYNKGFELNLINLENNSRIELPADGKDRIVVEMILEA